MNVIVMAGLFLACLFLLHIWFGFLIAALCATGLTVCWCWFNYYTATTGLIKVCLEAYIVARRSGHTHESALKNVTKSRYAILPKRREQIEHQFAALKCNRDQSTHCDGTGLYDLKLLICLILACEHKGAADPEFMDELSYEVDRICDSAVAGHKV